MTKYTREEKLNLTDQVALTKEVYTLLKNEKWRLIRKKEKMSMAKLACNAIIEKYDI